MAGDPSAGQTLVTGDTVNTAARLEQAAAPGEILIGVSTWRLVRDGVAATRVGPVSAKGKALPVLAYQLEAASADAGRTHGRLDAPLVGREEEMARLTSCCSRVMTDRRCAMVVVIGAAGVGKSRLVRESLAALGAAGLVLRGRRLSYGEGITYWAVAEVIRQAAGIMERDDRPAARRKLVALLGEVEDARLIAERLAAVTGLSDDPAPQVELFWAVRRTLEHLARRRPVVVVWEDLHWGEPTFLDLLEHVVDSRLDAPLLFLAASRPELLEDRPGWNGRANVTAIHLDALPPDAAARLMDALPGGTALPHSVRARIAAAAEGNPLFVEELLAMLLDDGVLRDVNGTWRAIGDVEQLTLPLTIHALLAARLERLSLEERRVAESGSVVGRVFEPEAVAALTSRARGSLPIQELLSLVRRDFVRPDRSEVTGGDAYKFRHVLIRDAAYAGLSKRQRAELHERFADWLEDVAGDRRVEFEEVLAYHFEQAYRYWEEVRSVDPQVIASLRTKAGRAASSAARRAGNRDDYYAARSLWARAVAAAPAGTAERATALIERARVGEMVDDATAVERLWTEAVEESHSVGDRALVVRAQANRSSWESREPSELMDKLRAWIAELAEAGDLRGEAEAWESLGGVYWREGLAAPMEAAAQESIRCYRAIGDDAAARNQLDSLVAAAALGPMHASEGIERCRTLLAATRNDSVLEISITRNLALLLGLQDKGAEARKCIERAAELNHKFGLSFDHPSTLNVNAYLEELAGRLDSALFRRREALDELTRLGHPIFRARAIGNLAANLVELGRDEEAEPLALEAVASAQDKSGRALCLAVLGRTAAARGEYGDAIAKAQEAVDLSLTSDFLLTQGTAHLYLGLVQHSAGGISEARRSISEAIRLFDTKGNVVGARDARRRLAGL